MSKTLGHLLLVNILLSMPAHAQQIIKISADDYCPFTCNPKSGKNGILIDLTEQILKKSNYKVEYVFLPWTRAINYFSVGRVDILAGEIKNNIDQPYLKNALFTKMPILKAKVCYFTHPDSTWKFEGVESLRKGRLGLVQNYGYSDDIKRYVEKEIAKNSGLVSEMAGDNALEKRILQLKAKRIDFIYDIALVIDYTSAKNSQMKLRKAGCPKEFEMYLPVRKSFKGGDKVVEAFNKEFESFKKSPEMAKILKKYGVSPEAFN